MDPHTQFFLEVCKIAATIFVGVVAACITGFFAWRQWNTAEAARAVAAGKLNQELFKERYELFLSIWGFLSNPAVDGHPLVPDFTNLMPKARFLFGTEIREYMEEANRRRAELRTSIKLLEVNGWSQNLSDKIVGNEQWFHDEASNCYKRFAPYLDFSAWRAN